MKLVTHFSADRWKIYFAVLMAFIINAVVIHPANACYSGLVIIPTADLVDNGCYSAELQFDGEFSNSDNNIRILNTELGIAPGFEAGLDYDFSDDAETRLMLNGKYAHQISETTSAALGIFNVGRKAKSVPYLAVSIDHMDFRSHWGVMKSDNKARLFAGIDKQVNEQVTLMADHTIGNENATSAGINYQINDEFGIMAGVIFPNSGGNTQYSIHFVYGGALK